MSPSAVTVGGRQAAGFMTRPEGCRTDGAGVLMLHGVGARASRWERNVPAIAERTGLPVCAIDLPGHGRASAPASSELLTIDGMARYAVSAAQELGFTELVLVGTSLGGHVAARVAAQPGPLPVTALVLVAPAGFAGIGVSARGRVADRLRDVSRDGVRAKLLNLVSDADLVTDDWVEEEWRINSGPDVARSQRQLADYIADGGLDAAAITDEECRALAGISTLVAWGTDDRTVPYSQLDVVGRRLEGRARTIVFPAIAHAPYLEAPELFNQEVSDFINASASRVVPSQEGRADSGSAQFNGGVHE